MAMVTPGSASASGFSNDLNGLAASLAGGTVVLATANSFVVQFAGGSALFTSSGSGFAYQGGGLPVSGAIASIEIRDSGGMAVQTWTGLDVSAASFRAAVAANDDAVLANLIFGGADSITGTAAADRLFGYGGADTLRGEGGDDVIEGGAGADTLDGGAGIDTLSYIASAFGSTGGVVVSLTNPQNNLGDAAGDQISGFEIIVGSDFRDLLEGDAGANTLVGGGDRDTLRGLDGDDRLDGGSGNDTIEGGAGNDILVAFGDPIDRPFLQIYDGGPGVDTLELFVGPVGSPNVVSIAEFDLRDAQLSFLEAIAVNNASQSAPPSKVTIVLEAADLGASLANVTFTFSSLPESLCFGLYQITPGRLDLGEVRATFAPNGFVLNGFDALNDRLSLAGYSADDTLIGDSGPNDLLGNGGFDLLIGGAGSDLLDGGDGRDKASYATATAGVVASLASPGANTGDAAGDTYASIETLTGSNFADTLSIAGATGSNASANSIEGGGGADTMTGGANFDYLFGGEGDDILMGLGGAGDYFDGEAGVDAASYATSTQGLIVFLGGNQFNTGEAVGDIYFSIENLIGGAGADLMGGTPSANRIEGGGGSDWLIGQQGADTLIGGEGNDILDGGDAGAFAGDRLEGGAGEDVAFYRNAPSGVTVNFVDFGQNNGDAAGDSFFNIENIWGSDFNDTIVGNDGGGQVYGFAGNDTLVGNGGDDVFYGGLGRDTLTGGSGAEDFFFLRYDGANNEGGDAFTDFTAGTDKITVSRFWFGFGNIAGPAAALTSANADFVTNGAASAARPTFLWNTTSRELWFDPDGAGASSATLLATLQAGGSIGLSDIWTA